MLLCMIMERTNFQQYHDHSPPTVDAVYVDRGRALILELKAHNLLSECEARYMFYISESFLVSYLVSIVSSMNLLLVSKD